VGSGIVSVGDRVAVLDGERPVEGP